MHAEVAEQEVRRRPNDGEVDRDHADHASGVGDDSLIVPEDRLSRSTGDNS